MINMNVIGNRFGDIKDLPKEIKKELLKQKRTVKKNILVSIIKEHFGGIASLNEIMVAYYRKTGKVKSRASISCMASTLVKKGLLFHVNGLAGVYSIKKNPRAVKA